MASRSLYGVMAGQCPGGVCVSVCLELLEIGVHAAHACQVHAPIKLRKASCLIKALLSVLGCHISSLFAGLALMLLSPKYRQPPWLSFSYCFCLLSGVSAKVSAIDAPGHFAA